MSIDSVGRTWGKIVLALIPVIVASAGWASAAEPQSPDEVHTALRILASVYADMQSKLPSQLDRLPHENGEFHEGSGAMRDAMAHEPPAFRSKVLAALDKAVNDSQRVADASQGHDVAQVQAALQQLANSMRELNALFPAKLRAEPGSMPPPHHAASP